MAPTFVQKLEAFTGAWGAPPDVAAKAAAALAGVALLLAITGRGRSILGVGPTPVPRRLFLWASAFAAALLSILYIAHYLHGGPRIVDATTYFLQGRAMSHGDFTWHSPSPSGSFRGRFLLFQEGSGELGGIFPPGFPLLLSLGFAMGAPMVVGPAIAAGLVIMTYRLTRALAESVLAEDGVRAEARAPRSARATELHARIEPIARSAAILSMFCAALRYHTADTMAHGATALGIAIALEAALRSRPGVAGLALGFVVATRPVSAMAAAVVALGLALLWARSSAKIATDARRGVATADDPAPLLARWQGLHPAVRLAVGAVPGVLLLALAQRAVTGAWWTSSQFAYYAASDGPPGCFRYGFGAGVGCVHEHGDFVASRLARGYGLGEAALTTLRRLKMHVLDVASFEPLALLVLVPLWPRRRAGGEGAARNAHALVAAGALVGLHFLAYAPFYFDGNYPGGGARFFADVLPIEHALVALGVARLAGAWKSSKPLPPPGAEERLPFAAVRAPLLVIAVSLAGFAVHAAFGHAQLAERDGGRPMFEPDVLARQNVTKGLVFVDTDHGFNLGHDPGVGPKEGVVVARLWHDDRDRLLYDALGHPQSYYYRLDAPPEEKGTKLFPPPSFVPALVSWTPPPVGDMLRFEAEAEWPALSQQGGFAVPTWVTGCVDATRALTVTPTPRPSTAIVRLSVPVPEAGRYQITPRIVHGAAVPNTDARGDEPARGVIRVGDVAWEWTDNTKPSCAELPTQEVTFSAPNGTIVVEATGGAATLDRLLLRRIVEKTEETPKKL